MLLALKDSTVITYGIADGKGRFSIPCDSRNVIAKLSCMGYITTYRNCPDFNLGTIVMPINTIKLRRVSVEGQMANTYSDRTVYLPSSRQVTLNLSYNWIPSNKFSVSAFAQYFGEYNLYVPVYKPYNDGTALLRTFETDGDYNRTQIGMSFNYKLLNGNLQLAVSPSISFYRMTGLFDISRSPFYCNASATYYLGNLYFQASHQTRNLTVQGNRGVIYKDHDFYQVLAGWSWANWNVRASVMNLFRYNWLCAPTYHLLRHTRKHAL